MARLLVLDEDISVEKKREAKEKGVRMGVKEANGYVPGASPGSSVSPGWRPLLRYLSRMRVSSAGMISGISVIQIHFHLSTVPSRPRINENTHQAW